MMLTLIAALDEQQVIGNQGQLPWPRLPGDLPFFKATTMGKLLIMGRKTYDSLGGRPLPGRRLLVLSRDLNWQAPPGVKVAHSLTEVLHQAAAEPEAMVAGGAEIYRLCLPHAQKMILSCVPGKHIGDTYFPPVNWAEWQLIDTELRPDFTIKIFSRQQ